MAANFSLDEQLECIKREIGMRERVYPRWVQSAKMSQAKADREIACMRSVWITLDQLRIAKANETAISR